MEQLDSVKENTNGYSEIELNEKIKSIIYHLDGARENILKAGELYVDILKHNPEVVDKFKAYNISTSFLRFLERVGTGASLPDLMHSPFQNSRLSIADQKRIVNEKIPMLVIREDGTEDNLLVNLMEATTPVLKQVVQGNKILSLAEQKQNMMNILNKQRLEGAVLDCPWKIVGNSLIIKASTYSTKISKKELKNILKNMG